MLPISDNFAFDVYVFADVVSATATNIAPLPNFAESLIIDLFLTSKDVLLVEFILELMTFVCVEVLNTVSVFELLTAIRPAPEPSDDFIFIVLVEVLLNAKLLFATASSELKFKMFKVETPVRWFVALESLTETSPAPSPEDLLKIDSLVVLKLKLAWFALKFPPILPTVLPVSSEVKRIFEPPPSKEKLNALKSEETLEL